MTNHNQQTERVGPEPAEDSLLPPTIHAVPLFGPTGWRARNAHLYHSDASLRWVLQQYRHELVSCGAVVVLAGRLVAKLPQFDEFILRVGKQALANRLEAQMTAANAACEAAHLATEEPA